MEFRPRMTALEATRVVHDGRQYVLASIGGAVHCLDHTVFDACFEPALDCCPVTPEAASPEPPVRRNAYPMREKMARECEAKATSARPAPRQRTPHQGTPTVALEGAAGPAEDLAIYPKVLRHPLVVMQRKIWRSLKVDGPADLSTLTRRLSLEDIAPVSSALFNLRQKEIVEAPSKVGGAWVIL